MHHDQILLDFLWRKSIFNKISQKFGKDLAREYLKEGKIKGIISNQFSPRKKNHGSTEEPKLAAEALSYNPLYNGGIPNCPGKIISYKISGTECISERDDLHLS